MKKIVCSLLVILMLLCIAPAAVFAADSATTVYGLLSIDNTNVYAGMNKSYSEGYIPSVDNGTVTVILPLIASDSSKIKGDINLTVGLGDVASSPFVFGNYDKTVNGSGPYIVSLSLPMISNRIMGRYPVTVTANYTADDGSGTATAASQTFTVYVTVSDGKDPNATPTPSPTASAVEAPLPQPKIIIKSHTTTPDDVQAGGTFDLDATLLNTSDSQAVQNITVTAKGDTTDLMPLEDTGLAYIKRIGSGKTADFHVKMQVRQDAKAGAQKVLLAVEYENGKAAAFTENYEIIVQVSQPIRLKYDAPSIPQNVNAGDTISVAMNLMNMGKSTLYNVRCALSAPGLIPEGTAYLGNMDAGTTKSGDINVFIGTLNMTSDSGQTSLPSEENSQTTALVDTDAPAAAPAAVAAPAIEGKRAAIAVASTGPDAAEEGGKPDINPEADNGSYGPTQGKITITYEDQNGKEYTEDIDISTTIGPPVIQTGASENPDDVKPPNTVSQWWISVLIAGGIAAGLIVILRIRKKKKGKLMEDGHEDE